MTIFCSHCGTKLPKESRFCTSCGAQLKKSYEEEIELGEVTRINPQQQSKFSTNRLVGQLKNKSIIIIAVIAVLVGGFWFINQNPLQGNWAFYDEGTEIHLKISNKKADMTILDEDSAEVLINGELIKKTKEKYKMSLTNADVTIKNFDVVDDKEEFEETLDLLKDEVDDISLSTNQRKIVDKILNSYKLSGTDITYSFNTKDLLLLSDTEVPFLFDFFISTDMMDETFIISKKGNDKIELRQKEENESIILDKNN